MWEVAERDMVEKVVAVMEKEVMAEEERGGEAMVAVRAAVMADEGAKVTAEAVTVEAVTAVETVKVRAVVMAVTMAVEQAALKVVLMVEGIEAGVKVAVVLERVGKPGLMGQLEVQEVVVAAAIVVAVRAEAAQRIEGHTPTRLGSVGQAM